MHLMAVTKRALIIGTVCSLSLGIAANASARGYGHGYGHGGHHYRGGHHSSHGAYLAGGLLLGSIIAHSYHTRHAPVYAPVVAQRTVVHEPVVVTRKPTRRLFRDRNGNCFERTTSTQGDEMMVELDPAECAW